MSRPLVSVVIPSYNRARTIARAVDSVLSQDYPAIEVIVVDDGSKDDTGEVMESRYGRDPRVVYLRQENGGVCAARNAGLSRVRGELVAMLDSDDLWLPGKLAMQVEFLRQHPDVAMVWTDMAAVDPEGRIVHESFQDHMFDAHRFFPDPDALYPQRGTLPNGVRWRAGKVPHVLILGNLMLTSSVVARADRLREAGSYDQSCHPCEDQDYYFRVCKTGPVAFLDTATVHYTIGGEDAESGPRRAVALSKAYLRVVQRRLLDHPELVAMLPPGAVQRALSDGYSWAGYAHFSRGLMSDARRYLWSRLKSKPTDLAAVKYLAASFLPVNVVRALRSTEY